MAYEDEVLAFSPTSYWKLDETSGAAGYADETGGITLTDDGVGISWNYAPLPANDPTGRAVSLISTLGSGINGSTAYAFTGTNSYTILGWLKLDSFSAANGNWIWSHSDGGLLRGTNFNFNAPAVTMTATRASAAVVDDVTASLTSASAHSRHLYAYTYDGTDQKIWIDGVEVASEASGLSIVAPVTNLNFTWFKFAGGGSSYSGLGDELAVWDGVALTGPQQLHLFQAGSFMADVAWWAA